MTEQNSKHPRVHLQGHGEVLKIQEDRLIIERRRWFSRLHKSRTTVIPFSEMEGVEFGKATWLHHGYLTFKVAGQPAKSGLLRATRADNSVVFRRSQQKDFLRLRDALCTRFSLVPTIAVELTPRWFYEENRQPIGPVSKSELVRALSGRPNSDEILVWGSGSSDWIRAGDVPGLLTKTAARVEHRGQLPGDVQIAKLDNCPSCGQKISTAAIDCPKCGSPLSSDLWVETKRKKKKREIIIGSVCWGIIFIGVAIYYGGSDQTKSPDDVAPSVSASSVETPARPVSDMRITADAIGCKSKTMFSKLTSVVAAGDREAWEKLRLAAILAGECTSLTPGTKVFLEETAIFSGIVCVRPHGQVDCFWTNTEVVK